MADLKEEMSGDEIEQAFRDCTHLSVEFKNELLNKLNATYQAMYNAVKDPSLMRVSDPYGDTWVEQYNRFVEMYQRYHP